MDASEDSCRIARSIEDASVACCRDCEEKIRNAPWTSVFIAAAVGYFVRPSMIIGLVGLIVRLLLASVRPALTLFAICKVTKLVQGKCCAASETAARSDATVPPVGL